MNMRNNTDKVNYLLLKVFIDSNTDCCKLHVYTIMTFCFLNS